MLLIFDENVPDCIVNALVSLTPIAFPEPVLITSVLKLGLLGHPDEEVLHAVGKDGILITYDKDFKRQRSLSHIINQHEIGVFWIRQPKIKTAMILAQILVKHWPVVLQTAHAKNRPFLYEIESSGVSERFF